MSWTATLEGNCPPEQEQALLNSLATIVQSIGATGGFWTTEGPHVDLASYELPEKKKSK